MVHQSPTNFQTIVADFYNKEIKAPSPQKINDGLPSGCAERHRKSQKETADLVVAKFQFFV